MPTHVRRRRRRDALGGDLRSSSGPSWRPGLVASAIAVVATSRTIGPVFRYRIGTARDEEALATLIQPVAADVTSRSSPSRRRPAPFACASGAVTLRSRRPSAWVFVGRLAHCRCIPGGLRSQDFGGRCGGTAMRRLADSVLPVIGSRAFSASPAHPRCRALVGVEGKGPSSFTGGGTLISSPSPSIRS
jgi:hypothetical protein